LYDARHERLCIVDVNPRLGGPFRTFVDHQRRDLVQLLYCDQTGQPTAPLEPRAGRRWLHENLDLLAVLRSWRERGRASLDWPSSLRGVEELTWFAPDDPAPFLVMCVVMAASVFQRDRAA
jgi:predicted ATP-grasp superfamily ATP-dependent carboligase